jgi:hypothetical protein
VSFLFTAVVVFLVFLGRSMGLSVVSIRAISISGCSKRAPRPSKLNFLLLNKEFSTQTITSCVVASPTWESMLSSSWVTYCRQYFKVIRSMSCMDNLACLPRCLCLA